MTSSAADVLSASLLTAGLDERVLFRSLFESYPDSLLLVDQAGRIALANRSASKLLGYTVDELTGLNVDTLVPDAIRPRHAAYREAYGHVPRARPMGTQMELVAKRKDGSEVMVEIALSPLQREGLPFVVAAIRDIGNYPRVKQALQRARYSEHLAQLGRIAVDTRDPNELLHDVPAIAAQALQVEAASVFLLEPAGERFWIAGGIGPVAGERVGQFVDSSPLTSPGYVLSLGQPVIVTDYATESRFSVPQSYRDAGLVSAMAVPISDRRRIIGTLHVRSVTGQRFGDDEVRFLESLANLLASCLQRAQSEEALRDAQRLESVGKLTGGIAHDFNNLLTVIQGNLQVLEELPFMAQHDYAQQLVGAASRATRRGAELTGKLLAFSRRQVLQPALVDVSGLLHSLADMLRRTLDQHIRIEVDVAPDCPSVLADPGQLESALLNIAINARDAMPTGGTLRFGARFAAEIPTSAGDAPQGPRSADGYVAITMADSGSGMSEAVRDRAFEPFFTTKDVGRGTGLGLSTVYGFVKQSAGAIAIDSAPGLGTTVSIFIPCAADTEAHDAVQGTLGTAHEVPRGLRVLLVEDEPEVRAVIGTFLDALHCTVTAVGNGEDGLVALDRLRAHGGGGVDLLVTDIALGSGMLGTELAREAQQRLPTLAVLLMSGFSAELLDADREAPLGWELLAKPCSREELGQAIAAVMAAVNPEAIRPS
ncbi:hypothetical protein BH09PSE5_BH09PSE5_13410 [soil metagenome]